MQKFLDFLKKFWVSILVLVCVAFMAVVYTYGALFDVLIPTEDNIVKPK